MNKAWSALSVSENRTHMANSKYSCLYWPEDPGSSEKWSTVNNSGSEIEQSCRFKCLGINIIFQKQVIPEKGNPAHSKLVTTSFPPCSLPTLNKMSLVEARADSPSWCQKMSWQLYVEATIKTYSFSFSYNCLNGGLSFVGIYSCARIRMNVCVYVCSYCWSVWQ